MGGTGGGEAPVRNRPPSAASAAGVLAAWLALALAGVAGAQPEPSVTLTEAAVIEREAAVEVWVRLSRAVKFQSDLMDGPWRLVLDFEDTAYRWSVRPVPVAIDPVRELRGSQYRKGIARLVIELGRKVAYTIDQDREGLRIVLPREGVASAAPVRPAPIRPAPVARPVLSPAPPARPVPAAAPHVRGILVLDEQMHAYIFDPATRQVQRYAVGDPIGAGVVEKIGERSVVLRTPTGRVELPVGGAAGTSAPAPPPASRSR
jgi:hypothetical protein